VPSERRKGSCGTEIDRLKNRRNIRAGGPHVWVHKPCGAGLESGNLGKKKRKKLYPAARQKAILPSGDRRKKSSDKVRWGAKERRGKHRVRKGEKLQGKRILSDAN